MRRLLSTAVFLSLALPSTALAASLSLSPSAGSYAVGERVTVRVLVSSQGQPINAVSGILSFSPLMFTVESVSKSGSVLNFWPSEPSASQSNAMIKFEGVSLSGFQGNDGTVVTAVLRATKSGVGVISFKNGQVLANDGKGTDVTSSLSDATYTVNDAPATAPTSPPQSSRKALTLSSTTHPDEHVWYKSSEVEMSWKNTTDTSAVRIGYDRFASGQPTVVYDPLISEKRFILKDGVWYFHAQERNADGWGPIATFKIQIDSTLPDVPPATTTPEVTEEASSSPATSVAGGLTYRPWLIGGLSIATIFALTAFLLWYFESLRKAFRRERQGNKLGHTRLVIHKQFSELREAVSMEIRTLEHARTRRALTEEEDRFIERMKAMLNKAEQSIEEELDAARA